MFCYLKTIEDLKYIEDGWTCFDLIGKIKNIDLSNHTFTLYAEDTDIHFNCIFHKSAEIRTPLKTEKCVVIYGHYVNETMVIMTMDEAPFDLTGSMDKDTLILANEVNALCSVQSQNGYIPSKDYGILQELVFKFRDCYRDILFWREHEHL